MKKNDERIIAAILSTSSVQDAADMAGISPRTISNRLKEPDFKKKLDEARRELWKGYAKSLQSSVGKAIQTTVEIMENPEAPAQVRLNAAESIIRNSLRLNEQTDFSERLEAIEKARGI